MKRQPISSVVTADQARDIAIDWQDWQSDQSLYMSEVSEWQGYFEALSIKFPELRAEFKENGII